MKKIRLGMQWACGASMFEVTKMFKNGKCQITEKWVAEDTGKNCKKTETYEIGTDVNGNEYAFIGDYALHSGAAINMQEDETTTNNEEETTMKNTDITFEMNGAVYEMSANGRFYCTPLNGKKTRIGKLAYEAAYNKHMSEKVANGNEEPEKPVEPETKPEPDTKKEDKPKAKKPRTKKVEEGGAKFEIDGQTITLTAKQVDFIRHLPDTCFWENGLDSRVWVDILCDEIGGQFAGKPMTVGAMVSTLCEKGLGNRAKDKINGRKATHFGFTEIGKKVAAELGL